MQKVRILTVLFENDISMAEIPYFRGAIIQIAGIENELFHNHNKNGFRYAYPLIQYKRINKKPMLFCLEDGVHSAHHFFSNQQEGIMLGNRNYNLIVNDLNLSATQVSVSEQIE